MSILQSGTDASPFANQDRRSFLRKAIGLGLLAPWRVDTAEAAAVDQAINLDPRSQSALQMRQQAAVFQCGQSSADQINNRDEVTVPGYVGCFTKGLPHDQLGIVEAEAYRSLL